MGPLGPWDDISQVPATFAGSSAAHAVPQQINNIPQANAKANKYVFLFMKASPLLECLIDFVS
jgi:hypothetical protein